MKINITRKQYRELITALGIANSVLGILGDTTPDEEGLIYKQDSDRMEELEKEFLQYANDFGYEDMTEKWEGEIIMADEFYQDKIMSIVDDYDNYVLYDSLSNELAWRDFHREHTAEEIEVMSKKNGDYFGVEIYDYEKKYWDEFEEHGFDRLEIVDATTNERVIGEV